MFRNALLISTLLVTSVALSGCSPIWSKLGDLSYSMAEFTKPASLRGSSTDTDVDFNETTVAENGVYKTPIGEYIPTEVTYNDDGSAIIDTSQHPCPEGTFLNDENACMFLETETFDFEDTLEVNFNPVDTGPVPCPEDTYLTEENTCSYFEAETISFENELQSNVAAPIETGPVPCPEGTYLTAENTCTYLETEEFDFASNDAIQNTDIQSFEFEYAQKASRIIPTDETQSFSFNQSVECPPGFKADANNSCMYLGAELTLK